MNSTVKMEMDFFWVVFLKLTDVNWDISLKFEASCVKYN